MKARELARRMAEALERDDWGTIEPWLFRRVADGDEPGNDEVTALRDVLEAAVKEEPNAELRERVRKGALDQLTAAVRGECDRLGVSHETLSPEHAVLALGQAASASFRIVSEALGECGCGDDEPSDLPQAIHDLKETMDEERVSEHRAIADALGLDVVAWDVEEDPKDIVAAAGRLAREANDAAQGRRRIAQILIAEIGAPGPETVEETAHRAVRIITDLKETRDAFDRAWRRMRGAATQALALLNQATDVDSKWAPTVDLLEQASAEDAADGFVWPAESQDVRFRRVTPARVAPGFSFHDGFRLRHEYPDSPEGRRLRDRREELMLSLREAARVLGLTDVMLGELERGLLVPVDPDGWARLEADLSAHAAQKGAAT